MTQPKIYLLAGEASGDAVGAKLMHALKIVLPEVEIHGTGGEKMQAEGLEPLFSIQDIAHMGFVEYLPYLGTILKRLRQVEADIRRVQPDMLVTIDAPGFNKQIVKRCQDLRANGMRCVHYVAPTVWAYKPERAQRYAALYDHLLAILPFEPPYFEEAGLPCTFVGHPVQEDDAFGDGEAFRARHDLTQDAPLLGILPGSRRGELRYHLPVFQQTVQQLRRDIPNLQVAILQSQGLGAEAYALETWGGQTLLIKGNEKADMFAACDVALTKSGTVTMELAHAGVPMVIAYRASAFSMRMIRKMGQVRFANLLNIIQQREIIPELIQEACKPDLLMKEVTRLLEDEEARWWQMEHVQSAWKKLAPPDHQRPSIFAAKKLKDILDLSQS